MTEQAKKWLRKHAFMDMSVHWLYYRLTGQGKKADTVLRNWRETETARREIARKNTLSAAERLRQQTRRFPRDLRFSILVPLFNPPEDELRAMLSSVLAQTYRGWELCLADGSGKGSSARDICAEYQARDARIHYGRLEKNLGISGNTNAALAMASGDYIALLDQDDMLHPSALYDIAEVICAEDADLVYTDEATFRRRPEDAYNPHFKPDYAPDTLRSINYICHFTVFRRDLLDRAGGGFRSRFDGSQDYDLILRLTEKARKIVHLPRVRYYWRASETSVAQDIGAKRYAVDAAKAALREHLSRVGLPGEVLDTAVPTAYRIRYRLLAEPLVSILVPTKDHIADLKRCVDSVREKTTYPRWEMILIENNSTDPETFRYYESLADDPRIRVVRYEGGFNYSAINNFGFQHAKGDQILLLNNDTEVLSPDWIQEMLMFAQREDVGAVGAKLYYPDHTIQHAGLGVGILNVAGHYHRGFDGDAPGYFGRLAYAQNVTAVTGACLMIPRRVYEAVHGLDESFAVAFNDVDLCMRVREAGYLVVFTPFAELTHYEFTSRGQEDTPEKQARFLSETERFTDRWAKELAQGDPYYNVNLTRTKEDFSIRSREA